MRPTIGFMLPFGIAAVVGCGSAQSGETWSGLRHLPACWERITTVTDGDIVETTTNEFEADTSASELVLTTADGDESWRRISWDPATLVLEDTSHSSSGETVARVQLNSEGEVIGRHRVGTMNGDREIDYEYEYARTGDGTWSLTVWFDGEVDSRSGGDQRNVSDFLHLEREDGQFRRAQVRRSGLVDVDVWVGETPGTGGASTWQWHGLEAISVGVGFAEAHAVPIIDVLERDYRCYERFIPPL